MLEVDLGADVIIRFGFRWLLQVPDYWRFRMWIETDLSRQIR